jgi:hypothetical protein
VTLAFDVEEVVVQGPPWNTRICVRYVARSTALADEPALTYRGMQYVRLAWGVLREEWIYPDTQAITRFFAARALAKRSAR